MNHEPTEPASNLLKQILFNGMYAFSVAMVISAWMISSAISDYGDHVERAAARAHPANIHIPTQLTLRLESGNSPIRIDQK